MSSDVMKEIDELSEEVSKAMQKVKSCDDRVNIFKAYYRMLLLMERIKIEENCSCEKFRKFMGWS
ncbi:hypothetical protein [Persephonella sp.]